MKIPVGPVGPGPSGVLDAQRPRHWNGNALDRRSERGGRGSSRMVPGSSPHQGVPLARTVASGIWDRASSARILFAASSYSAAVGRLSRPIPASTHSPELAPHLVGHLAVRVLDAIVGPLAGEVDEVLVARVHPPDPGDGRHRDSRGGPTDREKGVEGGFDDSGLVLGRGYPPPLRGVPLRIRLRILAAAASGDPQAGLRHRGPDVDRPLGAPRSRGRVPSGLRLRGPFPERTVRRLVGGGIEEVAVGADGQPDDLVADPGHAEHAVPFAGARLDHGEPPEVLPVRIRRFDDVAEIAHPLRARTVKADHLVGDRDRSHGAVGDRGEVGREPRLRHSEVRDAIRRTSLHVLVVDRSATHAASSARSAWSRLWIVLVIHVLRSGDRRDPGDPRIQKTRIRGSGATGRSRPRGPQA